MNQGSCAIILHPLCCTRDIATPQLPLCHAELVLERVAKLRLGDGLEAGVTTGPLISQAGLDKVTHHVNDAVSKGAQVRW
jgi:succinate-semialdehyde dehydrogenase/glutarate-semialdehyde dehydrogenase